MFVGKLIFWSVILSSCVTLLLLYLICWCKKIVIFREAFWLNVSFLGLLSSFMVIDLGTLRGAGDIVQLGKGIELFLLSSSTFTLTYFVQTLTKASKIDIKTFLFTPISLFSLGLSTLYLLGGENSYLYYSVVGIFVISGYYSVSMLAFGKKDTGKFGYGSIIKPAKLKCFGFLFLIFSPLIVAVDFGDLQFLGLSKGIYFLPLLFFIKNILAFMGMFRYLAVDSYNKLDSLQYCTQVKRVEFTKREQEVIEMLLLGKSHTDIATILFKSPNTIKGVIKEVYEKADVSNKMELLFFMKRNVVKS